MNFHLSTIPTLFDDAHKYHTKGSSHGLIVHLKNYVSSKVFP